MDHTDRPRRGAGSDFHWQDTERAEGGLRLHPDTIRALKANNPALGPALRPLWAALALMALMALMALVALVALPW